MMIKINKSCAVLLWMDYVLYFLMKLARTLAGMNLGSTVTSKNIWVQLNDLSFSSHSFEVFLVQVS